MNHTDDDFLFLKLKQGDVGAFETLFQNKRLQLLKFITVYTKSVEVAEELTQEVFVRLWNARENIDVSKNGTSYLYTIAKNLSLNYLRAQTKEATLKSELWERSKRFHSTPEEHIVFKEYMTIFNAILEELPQKKRLIYTMSKQDGKSHDEIAAKLGLSKKTVKNNLSQTLRLIRDRLEPYLEYTIKAILISLTSTFF